ncbi:type II toxin-antitoxin system RelE/ParE family toxin [Mesorhizobium mediterraneum]|uniref:type II toxin-antitoxin system RelE/ParE family toxin n=1 Tax=Mesorhizobium mediterraneum TaxID=43617 RepID=UPI003D7E774D
MGLRAGGSLYPHHSFHNQPDRPISGNGEKNAENIRPGLLKYPIGSHVLFLRIGDKSIDVVRILHQRMDYPRHL